MPSAKSIIPNSINLLHKSFGLTILFIFIWLAPGFAQDNSPYSRFGIGDLTATTNINNRGMGGITAGYTDQLSVNFNNPASFSSFQAWKEKKSKKLSSGRAILDIGVNVDNRTLRDPLVANNFNASNAVFSYMQVGLPLLRGWGMSFGLRPVSRISYRIDKNERLTDPITGAAIDSAITRYRGDGGAYLAAAGTGLSLFSKEKFGLEEKFSVGFNVGYLFGKKDYSSRRSLINDSVSYYQANFQTKTTFGKLQASAGLQYQIPLNKSMTLTLGAYGNLKQELNAEQDILRETFYYDQGQGEVRLDSVSDIRGRKDKMILPASYTIGFVWQKYAIPNKEGGWMIGADYNKQSWSDYRFFGKTDSIQDTWEIRVGAQISPVPRHSYFTNVNYRFGFFAGPDYVRLINKTPRFGASFGAGLPIPISRQTPNQITFINVALEYIKRGNKQNLLQDNLFRFTLGFSLSDIWFIKRQYD
ncbi:MAG: hypothetical protein FJY16_03545 [Bacteroidetes bacterium]|nr:hypothetical protein [Bacteroidota bacterium]